MGARLVFDDGHVRELSDEELRQIQTTLDEYHARKTQAEQILAALEKIKNNPEKESPEWWDEFDQFLHENRVHF